MTMNIKLAREALGLSQSALAELMELEQSTISLWEGGKRYPKKPSVFFIETLLRDAGLDPSKFQETQAAE